LEKQECGSLAEVLADTGWIFFREENHRVQINARRTGRTVNLRTFSAGVPDLSCQPQTFAEALLGLAGRTRRSTVQCVAGGDHQVLHRRRGRQVEADHSPSFHVQSLRSFFRYASSQGWCMAGIAESIDAPRLYTYENLPQGPSWEDVKKLLASVNGASPSQIRSRCAILLCAVYGLRVGEVCRLRLEDIDWAEERISVRRSKQRIARSPPLRRQASAVLVPAQISAARN